MEPAFLPSGAGQPLIRQEFSLIRWLLLLNILDIDTALVWCTPISVKFGP